MAARTPKTAVALALLALCLQMLVCAVDGKWCFRTLLAADTCTVDCCTAVASEELAHAAVTSHLDYSHNTECCLEQQPERIVQPVTQSNPDVKSALRLDLRATDALRANETALGLEPPGQSAQQPPGLAIVRTTVLLI